ncbi:lytic transglycosylase domain-containing protein [Zooshikella marina]|uniref:lytic transglycosylase domain-containing protein n=1 Tax=Zooshikella ganghwensis TaxID=202772 RepID=UPI001BB02A38|nr:lytic transglycosylase domain-containing protein [Zooshikella ganghwensis]MBU2708720.1 lytic transglycosylase domain-containing protein [Zooshikella ganghwensis]
MLDMPPEPPLNIPHCMVQAASDYNIPLRGLLALWMVEGGQIGTVSKNTNGTNDYGPFQTNTVWVKKLKKDFGITAEMLTDDFCLSARTAAYILRYEINLAGGSFWDGVGHYHSRTPKYKYKYIKRVYQKSLLF